ncbi:unnamed protein product, partial [Mesorhabditis belari]|uniref:EGF-like domain-containing protein n=1 Tax=Mesorhabditis belari TaxID=2138241 RepID=A0AAF3J3P3_9BILA
MSKFLLTIGALISSRQIAAADLMPSSCGNTVCALNSYCDSNYQCHCNVGWQGNGTHCEDINECNQPICPTEARCVNFAGGYRCDCPMGYEIKIVVDSSGQNGMQCTDIDECANEFHPCGNLRDEFKCVNVPGTFECHCAVGIRLGIACRGYPPLILLTDKWMHP